MTPIKRGTAHRLGLKLPSAYRRRWMVGISVAEVEANLRHNLPLLVAAGRVDWMKSQPPVPETMHVAGYELQEAVERMTARVKLAGEAHSIPWDYWP